MGKLLFGVIGFLIGAVVGGSAVLSLGGGAMVGAGAGAGLVTGVCSVVQAATETGALTPEEADAVVARAAANLSGAPQEGTPVAGTAAECEAAMARLMDGD